jgi:hypothetical protein
MPARIALALLLAVGLAPTASANPVRHAGEWQTAIDGRPPVTACLREDQALDEASIAKVMARRPNADCRTTRFDVAGDTVTYALECTVRGSLMTSSGTITATGPDSFTSLDHTHGGAIPIPGGKAMAMPDSDTMMVFRRVGPCK